MTPLRPQPAGNASLVTRSFIRIRLQLQSCVRLAEVCCKGCRRGSND